MRGHMADKRIEPISDDLQKATPLSDSSANTTSPQQQPVNPPAAPAPQPPTSASGGPVAQSPIKTTPPQQASPQSDAAAQSDGTPPKPFTMDDPAQTAAPQAQEPVSSGDGIPKPFTMDAQQQSVTVNNSIGQQPTPTESQNLASSGQLAAAPQIIGPQQSAPSSQPAESQPISDNQTVNQDKIPQAAGGSSVAQNIAHSTPLANQSPQHTPTQPTSSPNPQLNADGSPSNPAQTNIAPSGDGGIKGLFSNKKTLVIIATIVGIGAVASFVFGYYLPNRPENVYSTGLERTGTALTELTSRATESENIEKLSRMEMSGDIVVTSDDMTLVGDLSSKFEEGKSESSVSLSIEGEGADDSMSLGGDLITDIPENSQFPDVFFRIRGLEALGIDAFFPSLIELENKWIHIDAALITESLEGVDFDEEALEGIDSEDVAEATDAVMGVVSKYIFTSGDNAVFVLDEIAGEDEFGDIRTYRYDVSIDNENARAFCVEVSETFTNTALYSKLADDTSDEAVAEELSEIKEFCDEIEYDSEEFDTTLWIDRRTKLLHKVRVAEAEDSGNYFEIGQRYDGGDTFEFFTNFASSADNSSFSSLIITNLETNKTTFRLEGDADDDFSSYSYTMNAELQPMSDSIEINRPSNAIPIEEAIEMIFGGAFSFEAEQDPLINQSSNAQTSDIIRETDMRTLRTGIESYYTIFDSAYPSLQQMNDSAFRNEFLSGINEDTFRDPDGSSSQLVNNPAPGVYAYSPTPVGCDNQATVCSGYTLSATMSTGQIEDWQNMQGAGFTQTMSRLLQ